MRVYARSRQFANLAIQHRTEKDRKIIDTDLDITSLSTICTRIPTRARAQKEAGVHTRTHGR